MPLAELQLNVDAVGNLLAAGDRVLERRKRRVHFLRAAQVKLIALHPHPVRVGAELARVDAQEHVLRHRILAPHVVSIARRHERQAHPLRHVDRQLHRLPLDLEAVVLDLDEIPIAEHPVKPGGDAPAMANRFVGRVAAQAASGSTRPKRSRSSR